ncbi:hypothetical protein CDAR_621721 [Caerostris darwini]|uniref:Uncharacterized protein n=1 Tax=Caerostris darwini TaxID=1538125 RepID=A0AAV4P5I8_9ARAC|nr:hypothetical protein CDAR_621721 [Caerostris darwini]
MAHPSLATKPQTSPRHGNSSNLNLHSYANCDSHSLIRNKAYPSHANPQAAGIAKAQNFPNYSHNNSLCITFPSSSFNLPEKKAHLLTAILHLRGSTSRPAISQF